VKASDGMLRKVFTSHRTTFFGLLCFRYFELINSSKTAKFMLSFCTSLSGNLGEWATILSNSVGLVRFKSGGKCSRSSDSWRMSANVDSSL